MIKKADVIALAARLDRLELNITDPENDEAVYHHTPAVKVINSVLSLGMNYKKVIRPRLNDFQDNHPDIKQVTELADFIATFPTPYEFSVTELNFGNKQKAYAINSVVKYVCKIVNESPTVPEEVALRQWAIDAQPQDCYSLNIKGFKLAGFQWLRGAFWCGYHET